MGFRQDDSYELFYLIITHARKLTKSSFGKHMMFEKLLPRWIIVFPGIFLSSDAEAD